MFLKFLSDKKGQMMVEVMIALSIVMVGLLGIFTLTSRSLSLNNVVASQYIGSNLAAEGIEIVKNLLDKNAIQGRPWNEGVSTGNYEVDYASTALSGYANRAILFNSGNGFYGYSFGNQTNYRRMITVETIAPDEIKVSSSVSWVTRDGAVYQVDLEDYFYNWR